MRKSMIYTVGTALRLAEQSDATVEILVEGQWLSGRVVTVDGQGVVLASDKLEHAVVRIQSISAVKVLHHTEPNLEVRQVIEEIG
jgi:hypothetical protein